MNLSIEGLATFAGAVQAVLLITQFIKPLFPEKFHTRYISYLVALIIQIGVIAIKSGGAQDYFLGVLNAFFIAAAAWGEFQITFSKTSQ